MAGTRPATPELPKAPASHGSPGLRPDHISYRSRASGDEAVNLLEATLKIDAVASVLAHIAVEHPQIGELIDPMVRMLDSALRLVERS
jgi:hypothetical protein